MTRLERGKNFLKKHICDFIDNLSAFEFLEFFSCIACNDEISTTLGNRLSKLVKESEDYYICNKYSDHKCKFVDTYDDEEYECLDTNCPRVAEEFYSEEVEEE